VTKLTHLLDFLRGLWFRVAGRCWACHRRALAHTPSRWRRCNAEPAAIVLTEHQPVAPAA
jgi:hypothetical protein